jgi:hypothetical protein
VDYQDFATAADEAAHMVADNSLAQLASNDERALQSLLKEMDVQLSGILDDQLDKILNKEFFADTDGADPHGDCQNDITDKVPAERQVYIVPVALTRAQYAKWEKKKAAIGLKNCKNAFLKLAELD